MPAPENGGEPGTTEAVLVARSFGAPSPTGRRLRRAKVQDADPGAAITVPVTQLTIIETEEIEGDAEKWLNLVRGDDELQGRLAERGLDRATRALAARRVASADPGVPDASLTAAVAVRLGYGNGDALVDGRYEEAIELPRDLGRRRRAAALRPQERMAALLGGRERVLACEELILRARADVDGGRGREAALQVRIGLEALLAEREALQAPGQDEDLTFLDGHRKLTGDTANEALLGGLSAARLAEVAETVAVCERVLRRRAARG